MSDNILTVDEFAAKYKVPKSWVYRKSRESGPDRLPSFKAGKYRRYRESEVDRWFDRQAKLQD
jgi:predicted DNA-binding transcriptional regulator AlpA